MAPLGRRYSGVVENVPEEIQEIAIGLVEDPMKAKTSIGRTINTLSALKSRMYRSIAGIATSWRTLRRRSMRLLTVSLRTCKGEDEYRAGPQLTFSALREGVHRSVAATAASSRILRRRGPCLAPFMENAVKEKAIRRQVLSNLSLLSRMS